MRGMIEYKLIRSKRKTIALSITGEFDVVVKAPLKMPKKDIESFVNKHSAWIKKHMLSIDKCGSNILKEYLKDLTQFQN